MPSDAWSTSPPRFSRNTTSTAITKVLYGRRVPSSWKRPGRETWVARICFSFAIGTESQYFVFVLQSGKSAASSASYFFLFVHASTFLQLVLLRSRCASLSFVLVNVYAESPFHGFLACIRTKHAVPMLLCCCPFIRVCCRCYRWWWCFVLYLSLNSSTFTAFTRRDTTTNLWRSSSSTLTSGVGSGISSA